MKKEILYIPLLVVSGLIPVVVTKFVSGVSPEYIYSNVAARLLMVITLIVMILDKESDLNESKIAKIISIILLLAIIVASVFQFYCHFGLLSGQN